MTDIFQSFRFNGEIALVTGASSGFGQHFAKVLSAAGAKVVLAARRLEKLNSTLTQIRDLGGVAIAVAMDVTCKNSVNAAFENIVEEIGIPTVLINNAGVANNKPFLMLEESDWDSTVDTNLKGPWLVSMAFAARLKQAKLAGNIVNISSILGLRVGGNVAPYCASKGGLIHLTKSMAYELARENIRVNCIAPGYVETDINRDFFQTDAGDRMIQRVPQRRLGQLDDLNGALLLLASDAGRYMTGSVIAVDGGHLVSTL